MKKSVAFAYALIIIGTSHRNVARFYLYSALLPSVSADHRVCRLTDRKVTNRDAAEQHLLYRACLDGWRAQRARIIHEFSGA